MSKKFDLNIETILDNWEVYHAIREIIANALDEQILSNSKPIEIFKDSVGLWHIRDYGRGIEYKHFTQNESKEKSASDKVIGRFGVGLKDALAVFYSNGIQVAIKSRHGDISLEMLKKEGFDDVLTLHADISDASDPTMKGTEFTLGVKDEDIERAKDLFIYFTNRQAIDHSDYGDILEKAHSTAYIYVQGVKVAEEDNYLFDYNITKMSAKLKKAMNRERSNVGKSAYSDSVKKMLLESSNEVVIKKLTDEIAKIQQGTSCDEIGWIDIQTHALKLYNEQHQIVTMTSTELCNLSADSMEKIKDSGREVVIVPNRAYDKIKDATDYSGKTIGTFDTVLQEYQASFVYNFIDESDLTPQEKEIWDLRKYVFKFYPTAYENKILISETLSTETNHGVYDPERDRVILKRSILGSKSEFCEVLCHELIHANKRYTDNSRDFENELGSVIGKLFVAVINNKSEGLNSEPKAERTKKGIMNWLFS